jgi:hypothetical protein
MKKSMYKEHRKTFDDFEEKMLKDLRSRRPLTTDEELELQALEAHKALQQERDALILGSSKGHLSSEQEDRLRELIDLYDLSKSKEELFTELQRKKSYLKPGQKMTLISRDGKGTKQGRRFAYVGTDSQIHIARKGKPYKVQPMPV